MRPKTAPIFVVDQHPLMREALVAVLLKAGLAVAGQAAGLDALSLPVGPIMVILDLAQTDGVGPELVRTFVEKGHGVLVYSADEDAQIVRQALAAGARGFVAKADAAHHLVEAAHEVLAGRQYISPRAGASLAAHAFEASAPSPLSPLSDQQLEIYRLLGSGFTTREIAAKLGVSARTIESYCARIMEKLHVTGMRELRKHAIGHRNS